VMEQGPVVLEADGLVTGRYPAIPNSFKVHQGEILGVAGLVGAGRSEIARALFGIDRFSGSVMIDGKPARLKRPQDAIRHGVFLIPEDRRGCGLTVELSVAENATLPQLKSVSKGGLVNAAKQAQRAQNIVDRMKVKTAALNTTISTLSGGNQQKVVLGRWLELGPKLLIVDEPTRGIDVGSIYDQLRAIADAGTAILMISSDMEEIINISDRVMVMHEGRITGTVAGADIKEETIMKLATGGN
jgi:ribose transport system ATP-binding protein